MGYIWQVQPMWLDWRTRINEMFFDYNKIWDARCSSEAIVKIGNVVDLVVEFLFCAFIANWMCNRSDFSRALCSVLIWVSFLYFLVLFTVLRSILLCHILYNWSLVWFQKKGRKRWLRLFALFSLDSAIFCELFFEKSSGLLCEDDVLLSLSFCHGFLFFSIEQPCAQN